MALNKYLIVAQHAMSDEEESFEFEAKSEHDAEDRLTHMGYEVICIEKINEPDHP